LKSLNLTLPGLAVVQNRREADIAARAIDVVNWAEIERANRSLDRNADIVRGFGATIGVRAAQIDQLPNAPRKPRTAVRYDIDTVTQNDSCARSSYSRVYARALT
jgi:hypothetical protein